MVRSAFSEPCEFAPLCCVQRSVHLLSTTGKVFVFICFHKLQGAEVLKGGTVCISLPIYSKVRICYACPLPYHVHLQRVYLAKCGLVMARLTIIIMLP